MNTKILVTFFIMGVLAGCSKDAASTKPVLKFKSVNKTVVEPNGVLTFLFDVSDNEGDVTQDTLFLKKVRLNRRVTPTIRDSFLIKVPSANSATNSGSIEVELTYQNYLVSGIPPGGTTPENDTLLFKFALFNKLKMVSDTFTSEPIVIIR